MTYIRDVSAGFLQLQFGMHGTGLPVKSGYMTRVSDYRKMPENTGKKGS